MTMKQKKVKVPYSNYKLPPSSELGGQFVDFNEVIQTRKVVKTIRRKRKNANISTK